MLHQWERGTDGWKGNGYLKKTLWGRDHNDALVCNPNGLTDTAYTTGSNAHSVHWNSTWQF